MNIKKITPDYILSLKPYVAGKTIAEVQKRFRPERISKLASNENRLGCSPSVKNAVLQAMDSVQDYPDPFSKELRANIAQRNNLNENNVLVAAGSESLISVICRTFFKHHENAVTANATFVGFFVQAGVRGVTIKKVPLTEDYRFDVYRIVDAIDSGTRLVYIANPNNPTGTYINQTEYEYLIGNIPEDVLLVMDEAYFEYAREVADYPQTLDYLRPNVILLRTFSKAYGLAGFRVGYALAQEQIIEQLLKVKLTFEPTVMAQAAAIAAFDDSEFIKRSVQTVKKGRERLYSFLDESGVEYIRSISNSVLMVMETEQEASDFTRVMLQYGVILRQTGAFGMPNCIRVTIGSEEDMAHFEKSLLKVKKLKKTEF